MTADPAKIAEACDAIRDLADLAADRYAWAHAAVYDTVRASGGDGVGRPAGVSDPTVSKIEHTDRHRDSVAEAARRVAAAMSALRAAVAVLDPVTERGDPQDVLRQPPRLVSADELREATEAQTRRLRRGETHGDESLSGTRGAARETRRPRR